MQRVLSVMAVVKRAAAARIVWALAVLLAPAPAARAGDAAPTCRVVPAAIDLGEWAAGGETGASAWIINTGERAATVTGFATSGPELTLPGARPATIPPAGALEIPFRLVAPTAEGRRLTRRATISFRGAPPCALEVSVTSIHRDVHLPPPAPARHEGWPIRAAPAVLDLGPAAPGERRRGEVWLVNTTRGAVQVLEAKGSCGCMEIGGALPCTIGPGCAARFDVSMLAQNDLGQLQTKYATFLFRDHDPLPVETSLRVVHPRAARVRRYLEALERGDLAAVRACLALDSRIWFGRRDGPGLARDPSGKDPWAEWDRLLRAVKRCGDLAVEGRTVSFVVTESNDLYRLVGETEHRMHVTCWLDADDEIEGILFAGMADPGAAQPEAGAFAELIAWARRHRPRQIQALYRDEVIVPSEEAARGWRDLALEWRAATGRPPVDLDRPAP